VTPTSDILIEKYTRQQRVSVFQRLGRRKRERSPEWEEVYGRWPEASRLVEKGCYAGLRQAHAEGTSETFGRQGHKQVRCGPMVR
jgi:hypothetical protein